MKYAVTITFLTDDEDLPENLQISALEHEGITLLHGGGRDEVDLTAVSWRDTTPEPESCYGPTLRPAE